MNMPHWLEKRAFLTPDRLAIVYNDQQVTFAELREKALAYAGKLTTLGVKKGSVVALLCSNDVHVPALVHAISYIGAVLLPLNIRLSAREVQYQLQDSASFLLIYDEDQAVMANELKLLLQERQFLSIQQLNDTTESDITISTEMDMNDVHTIMYTSGTTGAPKGVLLTYNNHWSSAIGSTLNLGLTEHDRWLAAVPLFHISGLSILMRSVIYGMSVVLHKKFSQEQANAAILHQGVTIVSVVSNMLTRMLDDLGTQRYPASLRCMLLGGGPAPLPLLQACADKGIPIFQTYGMTETASQIVTLQPEYMLSKLGSAGKPLFQSEIMIMKGNQKAEPLEAGEIVVRGPNVAAAYLNAPDATAEAWQDGWLHTGDVGYIDEEGFLYVLDRRKDLFISGGENVYPAEIEAVLIGHPAVADAGVIGIEHERWGKIPAAFVVSRENVTEEQLIQYCQDKLARYKIPSCIYFVSELPRNASNKLLRRELLHLI